MPHAVLFLLAQAAIGKTFDMMIVHDGHDLQIMKVLLALHSDSKRWH